MSFPIGIDGYCYHRYFGEIYPFQKKTDRTMSYADFIYRAKELGVDSVSLETCFLPPHNDPAFDQIHKALEETGLEAVVAWGHPDGFEGGKNPGMAEDLRYHLQTSRILDVDTMRVVGSSLAFQHEPHGPQIEKLIKIFRDIIKESEDMGVTMGIENHIDFTSQEILEILEGVGSPNFGVTFDTGNALRNGENPVDAARRLSSRTVATHVKDLFPLYGGNPADWYFFASVPVGKGIIDMPAVIRTLQQWGYKGAFTIEIDYLHPDYPEEDKAVADSIAYLKEIRKKEVELQ